MPHTGTARRRALSLTDIKRLAPCAATIDLQILVLLDFINRIHQGDGEKRDSFYAGLRKLRRILESRFQDFVERPVLEMYDTCWAGRDLADPTTELLQLLRHMQITNITGGHFFLLHMRLDDTTSRGDRQHTDELGGKAYIKEHIQGGPTP